jgi:hypothetical protein
MITNLKQLREFFSGKRPRPARCAMRLVSGTPEPGGSYVALPLAPTYVKLRRPARLTLRGVVLPAGVIGQVVEEAAGRRVVRFPGGVFASLPRESDLVEVVK